MGSDKGATDGRRNGIVTLGRKTTFGVSLALLVGIVVATWQASAWASTISTRLEGIEKAIVQQATINEQIIKLSSRLAVCESQIVDLKVLVREK